MGRIYRQADNVLVWLGSGHVERGNGSDSAPGASSEDHQAPDASEAMAMLQDMSNDMHFHELPYFQRCASEKCSAQPYQHSRKDWHSATKSLMVMLNVPWFTRTWVVQEIVLARRATLMHGEHSLPWDTLAMAWINWERHAQSCCGDCVSSLSKFEYRLIIRLASKTLEVEQARRQLKTENNLVRLLQDFRTRQLRIIEIRYTACLVCSRKDEHYTTIHNHRVGSLHEICRRNDQGVWLACTVTFAT